MAENGAPPPAESGPVPGEDLVARERAALALWLLQQAPLTTQALAERLGLTPRGTLDLLYRISRVVPVHQYDGLWRVEGEASANAE